MADVANLDDVSGEDLTEAQVRGILRKIDLNIYNMLNDGKLGTVRHQQYGPEGGEIDRKAGMDGLLAARRFYQALLESFPSEVFSQYDDPGV